MWKDSPSFPPITAQQQEERAAEGRQANLQQVCPSGAGY